MRPSTAPPATSSFATFHPTFLYESLWALAAFALLVALDRRRTFRNGQMVALYVLAYASGRLWIENLRIDPIRFDDVGGLRLIVWVFSAAVLIAGVCFWRLRSSRDGAVDDALYRAEEEGAATAAGTATARTREHR